VPFLIYKGCIAEFDRVDDVAKRPHRVMWGSADDTK
jgi:hypothetical protein